MGSVVPEKGIKDDDPIAFGKHKGKPLKDVPLGYLSWAAKQKWCKPDLKKYIAKRLLVHVSDKQLKRAVTYLRKKHGHT